MRTIALPLIAFLSALMAGCGNNTNGTPTQAAATPPGTHATIPKMQTRAVTIGQPEELDHLLDVYDGARLKLEKNPQDWDAWLRMSEAFITEARVTGNYTYNQGAALGILDNMLAQHALNKEYRGQALTLKATILLNEHRFDEARILGEEAVQLDPYRAYNYGVLVDANVELGNYPEAVRMSDKMVSTRPDLRSYSRVSYLREIHGDMNGAIEAMIMAVKAGAPGLEETSWCRVQLGGLYERSGRLDQAGEQYALALAERKNYAFALAAMGRIRAKRGSLDEAAKDLDAAIAIMPDAHFYEELARIRTAQGNVDAATQTVVKAEETLLGLSNGNDARTHGHSHQVGLEMARFQLEFQQDPDAALRNARTEYEHRPQNIDVNATLAAIYYLKNEVDSARMHLDKAKATGSKDPALLLMDGLITLKQGDGKGRALIAKAFRIDPYLRTPFAEEARKALRS